ncbi:MAG: hypothetical protein GWO24_23900, partial [Akkermansiaceae bacterium]|nr:hypothetical protein [Akkermansiaceae bacterium]
AGLRIELVNRTTRAALLSAIEVTVADPAGLAAPTFEVEASLDGGATWAPVAGGVGVDRFG